MEKFFFLTINWHNRSRQKRIIKGFAFKWLEFCKFCKRISIIVVASSLWRKVKKKTQPKDLQLLLNGNKENESFKYPVTHQWLAMYLSTFEIKKTLYLYWIHGWKKTKLDQNVSHSIFLLSCYERKRKKDTSIITVWYRLTDNVHISKLCFRGDRVDLTHVPTVIFFFNIVYMEEPCSMLIVFIMCNADAWISGDYMIVNGQNCWLLKMYPRNL